MNNRSTKTFCALLSLSLGCLIVGAFTGCASVSDRLSNNVQATLDLLLPTDFTGSAHLEHDNQYVTLVIDAGGLHRLGNRWAWTWLEYSRQSHFPIFSGLTWSSTGKVRMGQRTPAEKAGAP